MKDADGVTIKNGDFVKTERGAVLQIEEENGKFYIVNSTGGRSKIEVIAIPFCKIENKKDFNFN